MSIDRELRSSLHHTGEQIVIDPGSLDAVKTRGRRRRTMRQAGLGACAVIVGIGGGVVGLRALDDSNEVVVGTEEVILEGTVSEDAASEDAVVESAVDVPATAIVWEPVSASSVVGYRRAFTEGDGRYAALSTAPGAPDWNDPDVGREDHIYRSADGIEWEAIAVPDGIGVRDVAFVDGELVAVGTAATAGVDQARDPGSFVIAYPEDGWRTETLPVDLASALPDVAVVGGVDVAAAQVAGNTVVAVTVYPVVDADALLGDRAPTAENEYAYIDGDVVVHVRWNEPAFGEDGEGGSVETTVPVTTAPGVDEAGSPTTVPVTTPPGVDEAGSATTTAVPVTTPPGVGESASTTTAPEVGEGGSPRTTLAPPDTPVVPDATSPLPNEAYGEEIVAIYPLSEFGFTESDVEALATPPVVLFADDGTGFVEVARLLPESMGPMRLVNTDDVAVLLLSEEQGSAAYVSTDGRTWTEHPLGAGWITDVASGGLGVVATGYFDDGRTFVTFSDDGVNWSPIEAIASSQGYVSSVVVGDDLIAASVEEWEEPDPIIGPIGVDLEGGYVLMMDPDTASAIVLDGAGDLVVEIADMWQASESGAITLPDGTVVPVSIEALDEAWMTASGANECCSTISTVIVSRDGVTWDRYDAGDLFVGDVVGVSIQAVTPAGVIVRASELTDDPSVRADLPPRVVIGRLS